MSERESGAETGKEVFVFTLLKLYSEALLRSEEISDEAFGVPWTLLLLDNRALVSTEIPVNFSTHEQMPTNAQSAA